MLAFLQDHLAFLIQDVAGRVAIDLLKHQLHLRLDLAVFRVVLVIPD